MFSKTLNFCKQHKVIAAIAIIGVIWIIYHFYSASTVSTEIKYTLGKVEKGTVITTISGTGQVSAINQADIKAKVSSNVVGVNVKEGQKIKSGDLIMSFDSRDAQKAVRDAEANLASSKLSLEKIKQPTDALTLLQAENSLISAQQTKQSAVDDLAKAYEDGFNTVANAFIDLPTIMSGLYDILYSNSAGGAGQGNVSYYSDAVRSYDERVLQYKDNSTIGYDKARAGYDIVLNSYKSASRLSDREVVDSLISSTYDSTKSIADDIKEAMNLIQFYKDAMATRNLKPNAIAETHLSSLNSYTSKTNSILVNLLSIKQTIQKDKDAIINADRSIAEKTASLDKLKAGTDPLDIQSQEISLQQRQNSLIDAREQFSNYFIKAPFDATVAKLTYKKGDESSAGTVAVTLLTEQQIANISLNEVDVAKIKVGQKANFIFDAIEDLEITGTVIEVDAIGTVSQGVVSYNVKIAFDAQDARIKAGMSVSASIITAVKQDVLTVANSAVKSTGGRYYVEVLEGATTPVVGSSEVTSASGPVQKSIQVGLANDSVTEIVSGLKEGEEVIIKTTNPVAATKTTTAPSATSLLGGNRAGGNAVRAIGR